MKKTHLKSILSVLFFAILFACGNNAEVAQGPSIEEPSPQGNSGNGGVKLETMTGADPSMRDEPVEESIVVEGDATEIEWLDFETAIDRNQTEKKFIFIDMYTDWCGWCKKMDASTFKNSSVINYIDQNFYAVKFNPETTDAVAYKEVLYEKIILANKAYNELAVNLLAGKMVFPSFVVLNKREVKRGVIPGYQAAPQLLSALKRYVE